ncbi:lactonase family protein [Terriglobus roseus]|uniref:6-phosphogluconolactonase, cycloisomerase 2 family n=1 Tax=Terriglobus roseus TaxID=392734 RepID=A0A1G7LMW7_9BACT|nr:beta-propeller fold lactonase family protein [Terriglobus roseus]SDF50726.1 6-phosphogluconolactonase, cycloisomerase 2 family [Terriglobus roseus]
MLPFRRAVPLLFSGLLLLSGCGTGKFFTPETGNSGGGNSGGGGTASGNYLFVANQGANSVSGLSISSSGSLSTLTGSPLNFNFTPTALTVSRDNKYLWVGTVSQIFGYSIGSNGALTSLNSGNALTNANCADMQTSPDGKWLIVLDGSGNALDLFSIGSDGSLAIGPSGGIGFTVSGTVVPKQLRVAPSGAFVIAAMGTAGELFFSFNTSTGAFQYLTQTAPPSLTSDNAIAIDSTSSYLYEARSGTNPGLVVNTITSNGILTPTTSQTYTTGTQPYSVVLDKTSKYVYVANRGDNTISGWSIDANVKLTAISGSPFASGVAVTSLGADSTGNYIAAAAYSGSPDVTLYGFDSTTAGKLNSVATTSTGTNASIVALSY